MDAASWAGGCDKCSAGLRGQTAIPNAIGGLWVLRYAQAKAGLITFCTCRAGLMYRQYLHKVEARLRQEHDGEAYIQSLRKRVVEGDGLGIMFSEE